ncbi:hypothetical protein [Shewanella surugensis]|uniref:SAF domain-containing protein n=1 Tax=Shewanella surugensis TaxID=212020 RepID=A0ABT0LJ47_9GAMM|nr:hypothetical protein [Shewanella surugensis]MCL1127729.1 hypothetical protein [Shewanella surugensis]
MKKKAIFVVSVVVVCTVGYYFYYLGENDSHINMASKMSIVPMKLEGSKVEREQASIDKRKAISMAPQHKQHIENKEATYVDGLMFSSSKKAEEVLKASGKLRENLEGEVYLEINTEELLGLSIGDTFRLDIPELDIFYDIEVNDAYQDQFGNKTIEARLPDQDMTYSSVFTLNERAIYANVSTPDGIYLMQGNGQYAWMAETNDLSHGVIMDSIENNHMDNSNGHEYQEVLQPMISGTNKGRNNIQ